MEIENAVAALGALAQQSRLEVFRLLVEAGRDGLPAGQIAERLKIPAPTLSFHLSQLRHAGLVEMRRDGRSLIYAADFDGTNELMGFRTENCCTGDAAGCGMPAYAPQRTAIVRNIARKRNRGATRQ